MSLDPEQLVTDYLDRGQDPTDAVSAWLKAELAALAPNASIKARHALTRQAANALSRYKGAARKQRHRAQWVADRAAQKERDRAEQAILRDPDAAPLDVLVQIARVGKSSARISAAQALLRKTGARATHAALVTTAVVDPNSVHATFDDAVAAVPSSDTDEHANTRAIALEALQEVSTGAEGDNDRARAASALMDATRGAQNEEQPERPIWIMRGRQPSLPAPAVLRARPAPKTATQPLAP